MSKKPDELDRDFQTRATPMRRICVQVPEIVYLQALAIKAKTRQTFNQQVEEGLRLLARAYSASEPG